MDPVQNQANKLQEEIQKIVDRFSVSLIAPQKKSVECVLGCFDSYPSDGKQIQSCSERCQRPFQELQNVAQKEFGGIQNGFVSCQRACSAEIAPQIDAVKSGLNNLTEADRANMELKMKQCSEQCIHKAHDQLPEMEKRLNTYVGNAAGGA